MPPEEIFDHVSFVLVLDEPTDLPLLKVVVLQNLGVEVLIVGLPWREHASVFLELALLVLLASWLDHERNWLFSDSDDEGL